MRPTMNHRFVAVLLMLALASAARSQNTEAVDKPNLDVRPSPLPSTTFQFPAFGEFTLSNGLHVYVVEDHSLPRITMSMIIKTGDAYDPSGKEGVAAMTADMLLKGVQGKSAQQIAEALDGVGASFSTESAGESTILNGAVLRKHADVLFSVLGSALTTATFPEDEFQKLRDQYLASVASRKGRSGEIATALSRKVVYGFDHPLARHQTESSLSSIQVSDLKTFYSTWYKPNIASIAVVGDVTTNEVRKLLEKHIKGWAKAETPTVTMPDQKPAEAGVHFVARNGSVQSSIIVCAPAPSITSDDWPAVNLMASHIGSGFGSLLFSTLRETYSYTYSPFGFVTRGNRYNRIGVGADVRTSVTDSALNVILREINSLVQEGPDPDAFARRKAFAVGQYRLSYEDASNVASYLQSAWLYGMPVEWVSNWTDRMEAVGPGQIQDVARTYMNMFRMRYVVVGDATVKNVLESFGPIHEYDLNLSPVTAAEFVDVGMSAQDVVDRYRNAIGGPAVEKVSTVHMYGPATMTYQGTPLKGMITRKFMEPNKETSELELGMMQQEQWVDGTKAWISLNHGSATEADASERKRMIAEATAFPVLRWVDRGYQLTVKGKRDGMVVVDAVSPVGRKERHFFDATSWLLVRSEKEEQTPQGPITIVEKFSDYKPVKGVLFPHAASVESSVYSMTYTYTIVVNEGVLDADFIPQAKQ